MPGACCRTICLLGRLCTNISGGLAQDGTRAGIQEALRPAVRADEGRNPTPSAAITDSQSVKTTAKRGPWAMTPARRLRVASATS